MAEERAKASTVTVLNRKEGRIVLGPDPEELKAYEALPEAKRKATLAPKGREILSGQSIEVSHEEAEKLFAHRGLVDAAKAVPSFGAREAQLKAELDAVKAENEKLRKDAEPKAEKPKK